MAKFLKQKNIKIKLLKSVKCLNEKDLEAVEMQEIRHFEGELLNVKRPKKAEVKIQIVAPKAQVTRFQIKEDKNAKAFNIQWREEGKKKLKQFRYKMKGKEQAMKDAEEFRAELIKKFY